MIFGQLDRSVSEFISRCGSERESKIGGTYQELVGRKHVITYDNQGKRDSLPVRGTQTGHTTSYTTNNLNQYTVRANHGPQTPGGYSQPGVPDLRTRRI